MTTELTRDVPSYDDNGAHRHLVVSERLRRRRRELGLTQKEVVVRLRRFGVNTNNKAVSSLEHGAGLDLCKLPEVARALDCTLTYLVGLTDDPARWEPDDTMWTGTVPADPRRSRPGGQPRRCRPALDPRAARPDQAAPCMSSRSPRASSRRWSRRPASSG